MTELFKKGSTVKPQFFLKNHSKKMGIARKTEYVIRRSIKAFYEEYSFVPFSHQENLSACKNIQLAKDPNHFDIAASEKCEFLVTSDQNRQAYYTLVLYWASKFEKKDQR